MERGESASLVAASLRVLGVSRAMASGSSRSVHASPTPPQDRATRRKARSQYPAMGARSRGVRSWRWAMRSMGWEEVMGGGWEGRTSEGGERGVEGGVKWRLAGLVGFV